MVGVSDRSRKIIAVLGAVSAVAAFACMPKNVHSASARHHAVSQLDAPRRAAGTWNVAAAGIDDPFSRWQPKATSLSGVAPRQLTSPQIRVRAIIEGRRALALIQEGDATRIVGKGERIGSAPVAEIRTDEVVLANGTRLPIDGATP
jgi:type II secretory pathway component PulC